ncbi:MAG: ParB/RepB/Spo0J family partition protein [Ruminococcus sp.]|nr:ParB/RepB/Spo0J family partition protein [Candidatus Copronaster equi]
MKVIEEYKQIPIENILPHPDNPRKNLGDLSELSESLKANGFISNLTVVPCENTSTNQIYMVLAGHRRLSAAKMAGIKFAPCKIVEMTQTEQLSMMLCENMQRNELTIKEQADCFQLMFNLGTPIEEIAEKGGFTTQTVKHRLEIAKLDKTVVEKAMEDGYTLDDFAKLEKIESISVREKIMRENGHNGLARAIDDYFYQEKMKNQKRKIAEFFEKNGIERVPEGKDAFSPGYKMISSYHCPGLDTDKIEIPKCDEKLFYCFMYTNWVYLCKKIDESKTDEIEKKRAEEQAKEKRKHNELEAEKSKLEESIEEFIKNIPETEKNKNLALKCLCSLACIGESSFSEYIRIKRSDICKISKINENELIIDDSFINGKLPSNLLFTFSKTPAKFFFLICFLNLSTNYKIKFHSYDREYTVNNQLFALLNCLYSAGFEPIDENQKQYIDGTHPSYKNENE